MLNPTPRLAARFFNKPHYASPDYLPYISAYLSHRMGFDKMTDSVTGETLEKDQLQPFAESLQNRRRRFNAEKRQMEPYSLHDNGVAVIPIDGTLVHNLGSMDPYSGMTGYDGIINALYQAADDTNVKGILMNFDCPGGEVSGAFDCAEVIDMVSQIKPVASVADETMTSGALLLAVAGSTIYAPSTAAVGSVGVVMAHQERSAMLENAGVNVTLIHAGARKVDGNPFEPLSEEARNRFQGAIDESYELFTGHVAKHRGMSVEDVKKTEAGVYSGQEAKSVGFVDVVMPSHKVIGHFGERLGLMTNKINSSKGAITMQTRVEDDELIANARAEGEKAGRAEATAQADKVVAKLQDEQATQIAEVRTQERARAVAVMAEAKGKEETAVTLLESDMPTEQIIKTLGTIKAAAPTTGKGALAGLTEGANATSEPGADDVKVKSFAEVAAGMGMKLKQEA